MDVVALVQFIRSNRDSLLRSAEDGNLVAAAILFIEAVANQRMVTDTARKCTNIPDRYDWGWLACTCDVCVPARNDASARRYAAEECWILSAREWPPIREFVEDSVNVLVSATIVAKELGENHEEVDRYFDIFLRDIYAKEGLSER